MKISVLVFNISDNCLVRTYPIVKVLQRRHDVQIIGPDFGAGIFSPYGGDLLCSSVSANHWMPSFVLPMMRMRKTISGDVVYAFKPRLSSFGVGLLSKYFDGRPLVLDIEDWETASVVNGGYRALFRSLRYAHSVLGDVHSCYMECLTPLADEITVVSRFLQDKFGGTRLYHGADCEWFNPKDYYKGTIRDRLGLERNDHVVLFAGTARPHKGVKVLLRSLARLQALNVRLLIVGGLTPYLTRLQDQYPELLLYAGAVPHSEMPSILAASDLVVLPQSMDPVAQAQVPGKVFEAMAMAKPIIASDVSDLGDILSGCGRLVPPDDVDALSSAIESTVRNETMAQEMGSRARQKCMTHYSWHAMEKTLDDVFQRFQG